MKRIGVFLKERQIEALKREAARLEVKASELIRRAIDEFLKRSRS